MIEKSSIAFYRKLKDSLIYEWFQQTSANFFAEKYT